MRKRSEAEISTTWKLEDMVPDNETWEKQLKEASGELEKYGEFKGKLAESAENLYQFASRCKEQIKTDTDQ